MGGDGMGAGWRAPRSPQRAHTRCRNVRECNATQCDACYARLTLPKLPMPSVLDMRYGPMRTAGPLTGGPALGGSVGAVRVLMRTTEQRLRKRKLSPRQKLRKWAVIRKAMRCDLLSLA